jgi:hypothetical protein
MKYITVKFVPIRKLLMSFEVDLKELFFGPQVTSGYVIMNVEYLLHVISEAAICSSCLKRVFFKVTLEMI